MKKTDCYHYVTIYLHVMPSQSHEEDFGDSSQLC